MINIIIPSIKKDIKTLQSLKDAPEHHLIISREMGIGKARNYGAMQISNDDLMIFLDDDLILDTQIWKEIKFIRQHEFAMTVLNNQPCSRIVVIHQQDFWNIGGFDKNILYNGEDRDFYCKAILKGFKFKKISHKLITHQRHPKRQLNIHIALRSQVEGMLLYKRYFLQFTKLFRLEIMSRLKLFQVRTLLIRFLAFLYLIGNRRK